MDETLSILVRHPVRLFVFDDGHGRGTLRGMVQTEDPLVVVDDDVNLGSEDTVSYLFPLSLFVIRLVDFIF